MVEEGPRGPWSPEPIAVGTGWFNLANKQTNWMSIGYTTKSTFLGASYVVGWENTGGMGGDLNLYVTGHLVQQYIFG